mmetsp:Transcript_23969/g.71659  ORF Transcript_23969/g.71659 Transcript_23969/m.71659 type:complete len:285 (+) Transcript_23969:3-857(+)
MGSGRLIPRTVMAMLPAVFAPPSGAAGSRCCAASKRLRAVPLSRSRLRAQASPLSSPAAPRLAAADVTLLACAAGAAAAARHARGRSRRAAGPSVISRRVVSQVLDLPVREAPVKTDVAVPGAELAEETRIRRADQYRLLLFTELTLCFTDTDGDEIRIQKDGLAINEYVNGKIDVRGMTYFSIDVAAGTYRDPAGHGRFRAGEDVQELVRKRDSIFIDREFMARCLITVCLLKEADAYQVMMRARTDGIAVVGTYQLETAEAYCEGLKAKGLSADIIPVDNGE